jgi:hypothetical protein
MADQTDTAPDDLPGVAQRLASALEALTARAFNRDLFPIEVKAAFAALDAHTALREMDAMP